MPCYLGRIIFGIFGGISCVVVSHIYAQRDTSKPAGAPLPQDTASIIEQAPAPSEKKEITIIREDTATAPPEGSTQDTSQAHLPEIHDLGVAVAPSRMFFNVAPGRSQKKTLTITNDTYKKYKFQLKFYDFILDEEGKRRVLKEGEYSSYSLSRYIKAIPSVVELKPGEVKKVDIIVDLPDVPEAYRALWCYLVVDQVVEKEFLVAEEADPNKVVLGIIPSFAFGVWIYQNPPVVITNKVEIINFTFNQDSANKYVEVEVKNVGDGIAQCKSYVIALNTKTGFKQTLPLRVFVLLPGQKKKYHFTFPGTFPPGHYNLTCVLDFGSKEEIQVAEMEVDL